MGRRGKNLHNALVLDTFGQIEHARGLIASLLPSAEVEHLDLSTLEPSQDHLVDEKLRESETDLLYRVDLAGGGEAFVYVLLEHQSSSDWSMPFRLLKYLVRIWDIWQRGHDEARHLPPIVPVVLSHAPGGWSGGRGMIEPLDAPEAVLEDLDGHLPSFEPVMLDLW